MSWSKKTIKILAVIILACLLGFSGGFFVTKIIIGLNSEKQVVRVVKLTPEKTTLYFVGDLMLSRGVETSVIKNFNNDYGRLFENLTEFKNADILFTNLEGPVSDKGNNVGSQYSFRTNPEVLAVLKEVGFDVFSFANNHAGDWNMSAFEDTLARLDEKGIFKIGAGLSKEEVESPVIIEKNDVRFGFIGFSDVGPIWMEAKTNTAGILLASDPHLDEIVSKAKEKCDVLIVSFHWGEEYETVHNSRQQKLGRQAIDSGANLVIGHHPHVVQDIEIYKEKPIVYSLGNFIFDQHFSEETMQGMVFIATFEGKILEETQKLITIQNNKYQIEGIYNEEELKDRKEILSSFCAKPQKEYTNMFFLNVNQEVGLPDSGYIPKDLVDLGNLALGKICLTLETKKALAKMIEGSEKEGLSIKVASGYRSFSYQKKIFDKRSSQKANVLFTTAKPGHSEHQLGTTVDLVRGSTDNSSRETKMIYNTPEDFWLRQNAYKYGFIQSYPFGKEEITGYYYEPWHYRYLGVENAKMITDLGITTTEFLK